MTSARTPAFDDKAPTERVLIAFDFGRNMASVTGTPSVTIARLSGAADDNPSAMLDGSPTISAAKVLQWIEGGTDGTRYLIGCQAEDADGQVLVEAGTMLVREVLP